MMRIGIAAANEQWEKHVVLVVPRHQVSGATRVIRELLPKDVKAISDFNKVTQCYRFRFNIGYLDTLMLAFPQADLSAGVRRRLSKKVQHEIAQIKVPDIVVPGLYDREKDEEFVLFDYQKIGIKKMAKWLSKQRDKKLTEDDILSFLQNDEMGLGKTIMALCTLVLTENYPALVVVPKNGLRVWEREAMRKLGIEAHVVSADSMRPAERSITIAERHNITVVNPEMLRGQMVGRGAGRHFVPNTPELFDFEYKCIVVDEYHRFGNLAAQQTQGYISLQTETLLPMSGTPFMSSPLQLWPTLHKMAPNLFPAYEGFRDSIALYEGADKSKPVGYNPKQMKKLQDWIEVRSIRRRRDHVLKDLPEMHVVTVPIELTKEQRKLYNVVRDEFALVLDSGERVPITAMRTHLMRLKQACFSPELYGGSRHSAKIEELRIRIKELVDSGEKALIGSEWSKATRIMQREFAEWNPAYVDGSVNKTKDRMAQVDKFEQDDDCKLYIGTIGANREVISLPSATYVGFADEDWSPQINDQFIKRSAVGGLRGLNSDVKQVIVMKFRAIDTVEEHIEEYLKQKQNLFSAFVDKDGGADIKRSEVRSLRDLL